MVQMGMSRILEAIYEQDFLDFFYGFRPGRSCHQALARLDYLLMRKPGNYVIDADIKGFFDNGIWIKHKPGCRKWIIIPLFCFRTNNIKRLNWEKSFRKDTKRQKC